MELELHHLTEVRGETWLSWQKLLSDDERARSQRYRNESSRQAFIAGRALIRQRLGQLLDLPPEKVPIGMDTHGKPFVKHYEGVLQFNLSHGGDWLLLVWHQGPEAVGADIEPYRSDYFYADIAGRYFSENEQRLISNAREFFALWTQKESLLKAWGTGLLDELRNLDLSSSHNEVRVVHPIMDSLRGRTFYLTTFHANEWVCSVATELPEVPRLAGADKTERKLVVVA
ncbi:MAG: hypothetical protein KatS3mg029_0728 [Saprospiraceae bacterium]|nr:MAG: hypothetical protein KatS3mg029_0728 [Saprospiraceae bacterium]